jgi:SAM-dependent methyltransferase
MNYSEYKEFVLNNKAFEREIDKSDFRENFKGKHSFIMSFIRFFKVNLYLEKIIKDNNLKNPKIIDVGSFPGNMVLLSNKIFANIPKYFSIGLELEKKFIEKMREYNVRCIDTEIDPQFPESKKIIDWNLKNFDICYFLDTIEHLVDPIFCLDQINKSLKNGGHLLITTDNITNFLYIADMIRKGKSPNVPPVLSSMVYRGNWCPHHKEFSKEELEFILERCGFRVVKHEYFDRKQGDYFIDVKSNSIKKHKIKKRLKNMVYELIKNTGFLVQHLRNHHIILAKKIKDIDEVTKDRVITHSKKEWGKIRENTIGY